MHMLHLAQVATTMFPGKKGSDAAALIAIGTHGTMGNLLMKEIEYYKKLESNTDGDPDKKHGGSGGVSRFWRGFGFFKTTWQRWKSNGGSSDKFLPRICMMADVAECRHNHRHANKIPGFNYHNLEAETKQYKIWTTLQENKPYLNKLIPGQNAMI
ncbi:hypothetical protein L1987_58476 [Smallanthus sonchifolius]|uniref:Uncharacterized protein n=1 Tax=Smallanthus sonchifolius TaxID=185202 RepID=A0ACB9DFR4_9ASTR|nr:hypothetical protein L1987_58476 [Smallanthus sonchifolius]